MQGFYYFGIRHYLAYFLRQGTPFKSSVVQSRGYVPHISDGLWTTCERSIRQGTVASLCARGWGVGTKRTPCTRHVLALSTTTSARLVRATCYALSTTTSARQSRDLLTRTSVVVADPQGNGVHPISPQINQWTISFLIPGFVYIQSYASRLGLLRSHNFSIVPQINKYSKFNISARNSNKC